MRIRRRRRRAARLADPGQPRRRLRRGAHDSRPDDQHMHLAELAAPPPPRERAGCLMPAGFVFEQDEDGHASDHLRFGLAAWPPARRPRQPSRPPCASRRLDHLHARVSRGAGSTPRSAGFTVSIGFFRAFMMFGRRRSAARSAAGRWSRSPAGVSATVSSPPSTSRVTVIVVAVDRRASRRTCPAASRAGRRASARSRSCRRRSPACPG